MEFQLITLSPFKRRLVYVASFELLGVFFATWVLMALSGGDAQESLPVAVLVSTTAVVWNYIYNTVFEAWERRRQLTERSIKIRCWHAVGFEGGLFLFCLPVYMLWYGVGLWQATVMESVLLLFFLFYTFIFTLLFDKVFTLQHLLDNQAASEQTYSTQ